MVSIKEILREAGVDFKEYPNHEHTTQGAINVDCPWCSPNIQHYRLGIGLAGQWASCWSCGGKSVLEVIQKVTGKPWLLCREMLRDLVPADTEAPAPRGELKLPGGLTPKLHKIHKEYLRSRGFDPSLLVKQWRIQALANSTLGWRIFIPIFYRFRVVSWTTRALGSGLRYLSASTEQEEMSHRTLLYGEDRAEHTIIVCEGPLDVWKIGYGAVATFGLAYTKTQLWRMSHYPRRYICFDAEPTAQQRAERLVSELEVFPGQTANIVLDSGKDPGDCSPKELAQLQKLLRR